MIRQHVYDVIQRILHWWLALTTFVLATSGLYASNIDPGAKQAYLWDAHMTAGQALILGLVARITWGIVGPAHARFSSFIHIESWISAIKTRKMLSADLDFGHHPQASLSYLGFYALILAMVVSGSLLAAILHGEGLLAEKWLDEFAYLTPIRVMHEYGWWAIAFFIVTHIGAMVYHERKDRIPIAQSMVSGYQYRTQRENKS